MQVAIFGEGRQRVFRLLTFVRSERIEIDAHGGRHLDLPHLDLLSGITGQHFVLVFKHHGRVADVVTDAHVPLRVRPLLTDHNTSSQNRTTSSLRSQRAARLRLQADVDQPARVSFQRASR